MEMLDILPVLESEAEQPTSRRRNWRESEGRGGMRLSLLYHETVAHGLDGQMDGL